MEQPVIPCFPDAGGQRPLRGLYLDTELPAAGTGDRPFIYANYVSSLDGRISLPDAAGRQHVPDRIANPRDWRLFQELAGHADLLLSSGRYLRELDAGTAQDMLPIGSGDDFADIRAFRARSGLAPQPDVAVLSTSLDFAVPVRLLEQGRRILVLTGENADDRRVQAHERAGIEVLGLPGVARPGGTALAAALMALDYRRLYAVIGPYALHTLIAADLLDALFLTTVHRVIGGGPFTSLCEGGLLARPGDFRLTSLYLDTNAPEDCSQSFARYDRCHDGRAAGPAG